MASPWKDARGVIVSTTPTLEGHPIQEYCGIVTGEVIVGANIFRDLFAISATSSAGVRAAMSAFCQTRAIRRSRNSSPKPPRAGPMPWSGSISITR